MLTTRGWWFLVTAVLVLALGVVTGLPALVPVGLALVLWFISVGTLFHYRARVVARRIEVARAVHDERGPVDTLWAGRPFEVRVEVRLRGLPGLLGLPHADVSDRVPFAAEWLSGEPEASGPLGGDEALSLVYRVRPPAPARARFEGLRLRLADPQGFFYHETFLPAAAEYRVLPVLVDARGHPATTKRHNLLPPPGVHRLRRPGSGSELLDLRDYLPGDPPRTIAWKVSARRDRLITKEFESEVPIRCTLFVDTSNSVRVGPPGQNALARLVEIAAAVAQANTGARDLTGLCLFDERSVRPVRPARTARHLVGVLNLLADAGGLTATTGQVRAQALLPLAHAFAEEVYPDLMRPDLNHVPFWLPWLAPRPAWALRHPTLADRLYGRLPWWVLLLSALAAGLAVGAVVMASDMLDARAYVPFWALLALLLVGWIGLLVLLKRVPIFLPRLRRLEVWRKRMAALLSVRHGLAPGGLAALTEDDGLLAEHLQRFLAEHHVPFALPLYDRRGRYLFASPEKIDVLARALLQAVGKGHDNELFVLLADLVELSDRLDPLLRAVSVALARHHQVMLVCPWPPGLPVPTADSPPPSPDVPGPPGRPAWLKKALSRATAARFHRAFQEVRQTFARLGVPVICAASDESVPLILDRLERLRLLGRRR
jgi:uncharacterized protein (DUF58 family)